MDTLTPLFFFFCVVVWFYDAVFSPPVFLFGRSMDIASVNQCFFTSALLSALCCQLFMKYCRLYREWGQELSVICMINTEFVSHVRSFEHG